MAIARQRDQARGAPEADACGAPGEADQRGAALPALERRREGNVEIRASCADRETLRRTPHRRQIERADDMRTPRLDTHAEICGHAAHGTAADRDPRHGHGGQPGKTPRQIAAADNGRAKQTRWRIERQLGVLQGDLEVRQQERRGGRGRQQPVDLAERQAAARQCRAESHPVGADRAQIGAVQTIADLQRDRPGREVGGGRIADPHGL